MKILLSGYYGFGNVGDESVLQAIIQGLRGINPKIEITVLSASPGITQELQRVRSIHRNNLFRILLKMLRTDVFVSGGGTLFQNATSMRSFLYYIGLILLARIMFKRVVIFAQGFGPLKGIFSRLLARLILNRVNLITLRDKASYKELIKLGITRPKTYVTADPSVILGMPPRELGHRILSLEGIKAGRPLLGIAVRSVPRNKEGWLYKSLAEAIDWLSREYNFSPVFVLFQCPEDMHETSRVINLMQEKSSVVFKICRPNEMLSVISNFDLLIGMRLHSLIFANMNRVPMLGISYDPKVAAFMRKIGQPCLKIDERLDFTSIKYALDNILQSKERILENLEAKHKGVQEQAVLNFSLFSEYIKPRRQLQKTQSESC